MYLWVTVLQSSVNVALRDLDRGRGSGRRKHPARVRSLVRDGGQVRLARVERPALMAEGVGSEHGVHDHPRVDLERLVVDGLALGAGRLGHLLEVLATYAFEPYVFEGYREAHLKAEVHHLLDNRGGTLLEHQHGDHPEGDLLAVPVVVGTLQGREAVVDRVRRGQPAGLEPEPREQRVVTEPGEREGGGRRRTAGHSLLAGARRSLGLEVGREPIPYAGYQEPHRRSGDDGRVDYDRVRVPLEEAVLQEGPVLVVDDREGARRGVSRGDGRHYDEREARRVRNRFGRVHSLPAPDADDRVGAVLRGGDSHPLYLLRGALAAELQMRRPSDAL